MGILKKIKRAAKSVAKVFKVAKAFKWLGNLNPYVVLAVFAIGWLFM